MTRAARARLSAVAAGGSGSAVRYAEAADGVHLAYRVFGDARPDLLFVPAAWSHVEVIAEYPPADRFLHRLGALGRLIHLDKRGSGLSDPVPTRSIPALEEWMDDLTTVLDAVDAGPTYLIGMEAGGPMALLYAATYPQRVAGLVLVNTFARLSRADDYSIGLPASVQEWSIRHQREHHDEAVFWHLFGDDAPGSPGRAWFTRFQQYAAGPGAAAEMIRATYEMDVRRVLPSVRAPVLIVHRRDNEYIRAEHGRYLHEHLPGSRYVEVDGAWHLPWEGDADAILAEIEEFVAGERSAPEPDRVLVTVLFTDIVDSTDHAARLGDARWRAVLDDHDELARGYVARSRGRLLKQTGDGVMATFDGPARAISCARAMATAMRARGVELRAGLHTGEVELRRDDIGGIAVHIAARVSAAAGPGEVLVSGIVPPLVAGSGLEFDDRGTHELKGVPGTWQLFAVRDV